MGELNIKSTTVEKGLDLIKGFVERVIGPTLDELGLTWSDNLKLRRLKNQIKNLSKAKDIVEANNLSIQQINAKVLFPYLEGVAVEEDDTLQDMWANLFVNYIDTDKNLRVVVYPDILRQLSTLEVTILIRGRDNRGAFYSKPILFMKDLDFGDAELNNLERLGLIKEDITVTIEEKKDSYSSSDKLKPVLKHKKEFQHRLTPFCFDFLMACTR